MPPGPARYPPPEGDALAGVDFDFPEAPRRALHVPPALSLKAMEDKVAKEAALTRRLRDLRSALAAANTEKTLRVMAPLPLESLHQHTKSANELAKVEANEFA